MVTVYTGIVRPPRERRPWLHRRVFRLGEPHPGIDPSTRTVFRIDVPAAAKIVDGPKGLPCLSLPASQSGEPEILAAWEVVQRAMMGRDGLSILPPPAEEGGGR